MGSKSNQTKPITGFPEWLPEERLLELRFLRTIQETFELFGFANIETPAVERNETLASKGEVNKQIYSLYRPNVPEDVEKDTGLSLHFDLTVPLARYVGQHFGKLTFPFRRYQIQKVWRGERTQRGRSREFYQCDIDIIAENELDLLADAEMPMVIHDVFSKLNIGKYVIRMSNRKILQGVLDQYQVETEIAEETVRAIDRLPKLKGGWEELAGWLTSELSLVSDLVEALRTILVPEQKEDRGLGHLKSLGIENPILNKGIEELEMVIGYLLQVGVPEEVVEIDLSITRGLDYYTGTVYETFLLDHEHTLGSVCSGGRYDNLSDKFIDRKLPGVGMSIGLTRLFSGLLEAGTIQAGASTPAQVAVTVPDRDRLEDSLSVASLLRGKGFKVDLFVQAQKHDKQLKAAVRKGIPFAVIPWPDKVDEMESVELRDLRTGDREVVLIHEVATVLGFMLSEKGRD
ncbi:MAG: histidine--tRNA ligase [Candidatus Omnitrophica bacterium]|nr:histidine--tRNA ligase [Candidatus Omnitrophota bacterium]